MKVLILKQANLKQGLEEIENWIESFTDIDIEFTIKEVEKKLRKKYFIHYTGIKKMIDPIDISKYAEKGYDIVCFMFNPEPYNDNFTPVYNINTTEYNIIQIPILPVSSSGWIAEYFWHEVMHVWYRLLELKGLDVKDDVHKHAGLYTSSKSYKNIVNKLKQFLFMINTPKYIIIHHTAISRDLNYNQYDAVKQYHIGKGWGDIGYHWFIEPDGTLKQGRQEDEEGAHTIGKNTKSIGICLTGNFDRELPTKEQEDTLRNILTKLIDDYNIPIDKITNHRDWADKTCPGSKLSDNWARKLINMSNVLLVNDKHSSAVGFFVPAINESALVSMAKNFGYPLPEKDDKPDWKEIDKRGYDRQLS